MKVLRPGAVSYWQTTGMAEAALAAATPASKSKLTWYINRLRCMSPAEIVFRAERAIVAKFEKAGINLVRTVPAPDWSAAGCSFVHRLPDTSLDRTTKAAKEVMTGHYPVFSLDGLDIFNPVRWNRDPLTGVESPLEFGKSLDYRSEQVVGNIKYLWEPNRHLHLVTLAQAWSLTGDQQYLNTIKYHLSSWFEQCPYPLGANWSSSLELGIRLINWSLAWQWVGGKDSKLFSGEKGKIFRERWAESIYQHVHFIRGYYSRHSSANNHLIGEAAGVYIATVTWPHWEVFKHWNKEAKNILEQEALKQTGEDGVNREQAISYQQFVLDFLLLCELAGRAGHVPFSKAYNKRIENMMLYLASVMDAGGNVPMIGDADDGYVVRLSQEESFCQYRSLLATGAVLFGRADLMRKAGAIDDKTRCLVGDEVDAVLKSLPERPESIQVQREFTDAGYYILGCDFETEKEIRVVADCGPLGYLLLAAHGHADALSFTLSACGNEFLIDPGTYAYHTEPKWRQYFRGTSAHNTVRIDGLDQSVPGGNFMWLKKAKAECLFWQSDDESDCWTGVHHGYERLNDPVTHKRTLTLNKSTRRMSVSDVIECKGTHNVERFWHFSEFCEVDYIDNGISAIQNGAEVSMYFSDIDAEISILRGDESMPAGWVSRSFDVKVPASTVVVCNRIHGNTILNAEIILGLG